MADSGRGTTGAPADWRGELRRLHDGALGFDWEAHLAELNDRFGLGGKHALSTTDVGLPPAWFNGDVEAIAPGRWVLVVSLNPGKPPAGSYGNELRPYAAGQFALSGETLAALAEADPGFWIAQRFREVLIEQARPAFVLINGVAAVRDAEFVGGDHLSWKTVRYTSERGLYRGRPKRLWHMQGIYATPSGAIPVVGFPFLKKAGTHNSDLEVAALGQAIRDFRRLCAFPKTIG